MNLPPRRHWLSIILLACAVLLLAWSALAPLGARDHALRFDIPAGTWERIRKGDPVEALPATIHLTLGVKDVLVLRNRDSAPHTFGPVLIAPGQLYRMPFQEAEGKRFPSTARVSGQIGIVVDPYPNPGMERLRWRLAALSHAVRYYRAR